MSDDYLEIHRAALLHFVKQCHEHLSKAALQLDDDELREMALSATELYKVMGSRTGYLLSIEKH